MPADTVATVGLLLTLVGAWRGATYFGKSSADIVDESHARFGNSNPAKQATLPRVKAQIKTNRRLKESFWWIFWGTIVQIGAAFLD
ncbi:hypothetical protein [Paracoccus marcusii]|uniref:Uncharacterized protein n=1 Tax=Paracoccus marcusii TaxID=59779 RepID=A0ABY7US70_9RHOB|nr:hypothetical protein [Paracoccus marcusii]WDA11638.1 hypothetical protein PRL19_10030 [Paracoccus marcusii]